MPANDRPTAQQQSYLRSLGTAPAAASPIKTRHVVELLLAGSPPLLGFVEG
jgi:hypothetical protein